MDKRIDMFDLDEIIKQMSEGIDEELNINEDYALSESDSKLDNKTKAGILDNILNKFKGLI